MQADSLPTELSGKPMIKCIHFHTFILRGRTLFSPCSRREFIRIFSLCLQSPVQNALVFENFQAPFPQAGLSLPLSCVLASREMCRCVLCTSVCGSLGEARKTGLRELGCLRRGLAPGRAEGCLSGRARQGGGQGLAGGGREWSSIRRVCFQPVHCFP